MVIALCVQMAACDPGPDCASGEAAIVEKCEEEGLADLIGDFCEAADTGAEETCAANEWIACVSGADSCEEALLCPHATPQSYDNCQ